MKVFSGGYCMILVFVAILAENDVSKPTERVSSTNISPALIIVNYCS